MADIEIIHKEIARIKQLKTNYDALITNPNSRRTIEAYHAWYDESSVVFSHYFDDSSREYYNFTNIDNDGNGYVLKGNYQKLRKNFCVLVDKLERGDIESKKSVIELPPTPISLSKKRIFISHASKDKKLIGKFVDSIILLGMEIESEIIAYTSREETGVPPGKSIPQFIQDNIACAEIVLLMISDNYKNSEVCMNEMGAAWALNKHIIQILLPNTSFDKLGWLCSLDKALKINCSESMDSLCEVFSKKLDIGIKPSVWNRNKIAFISHCATTFSPTTLPTIINSESVEIENDDIDELGFLDYRELMDEEAANVTKICFTLTDAIVKHNNMLNSNIRKLQNINPSHPNITQAKSIIISTAKGMDTLSIIFENNTPQLRLSFFNMIDNATKMKTLIALKSEETMEEEYNAIGELLKSISGAKAGCISFKESLNILPKVEKTINKSKKQLSNNLDNIISVLDACISKGQELLRNIL